MPAAACHVGAGLPLAPPAAPAWHRLALAPTHCAALPKQVAAKERFLSDSGLWLLDEAGRPLFNDTASPYFGGRHRHLPCEGRLAWLAPP